MFEEAASYDVRLGFRALPVSLNKTRLTWDGPNQKSPEPHFRLVYPNIVILVSYSSTSSPPQDLEDLA